MTRKVLHRHILRKLFEWSYSHFKYDDEDKIKNIYNSSMEIGPNEPQGKEGDKSDNNNQESMSLEAKEVFLKRNKGLEIHKGKQKKQKDDKQEGTQ